jgi:hypothetical protein
MTADAAGQVPPGIAADRQVGLPPPLLAGLRLARLFLVGRRAPAALAIVVACAVALRIALHWPWDTYGALQLPLIFEAGCAAAIAVTIASPFGEPERVTGRWLPVLRLGAALALTAVACGALAAAGAGGHLAGGSLDVARNVAGLTGIGLLCAAVLGGELAWTGPLAYLMAGTYALYAGWHGTVSTTPWIWPARPPHDLGAAICAGLVLAAGLVAITARGARDSVTE